MPSIRPNVRIAFNRTATCAAVIAISVALLGTSGCSWFRKKDYYSLEADKRPLDFPPAFDAAEAERSLTATASGSVTRSSLSSSATASRSLGFDVAGDRGAVFARVGELLSATSGLTIASRAQLLGAYDVDYQGQKFLVRISESGSGSHVSAVDARGLPADNDAASKLIAALKASLVRN